ncbi:MAG: DUF4295 domain-containing protein [Bacteroidales bacterium]|jgi:hypothetical protein
MAKKVVATLQSSAKDFAKVIKLTRTARSGAYSFKEEIIPSDKVQEYFANKS